MSIVYLRVKIRSLAEEARIIRKEERRFPKGSRNNEVYFGLHTHRTYDVRNEARHALLAYAFLRHRPYRTVEPKCHTEPLWDRVWTLIKKYGHTQDRNPFNEWRTAEPEKELILEECH